jgi:hypothetical protein
MRREKTVPLLALLTGLALAPAGEARTTGPLSFDRDSYADLAIGAPLEDVPVVEGNTVVNQEDAGAVNVLYGESGGLTAVGDQVWHQGLGTVSGSAEGDDRFGVALAAGDFDGDRAVDLAVGASYEDVNTADGTEKDAGAVNVLYGSSGGLAANGERIFHQGVDDVPGQVESFDYFGEALAVGDFDGDGYADLAVGVPFEDIGAESYGTNCGVVIVLYGSAGGLTAAGSQMWTETALGWTIGAYCGGNEFGLALAAGDFDRDGFSDLAAAAPERLGSGGGVVHAVYGSKDGLVATGSQVWRQNRDDLPGTGAAGDRFGHALVAADFDGDTFSDLAIGVPGDPVSGVSEAGAVHVLYGSGDGLTATGNQLWHQNQPDVTSSPEPEDHFGWALAAGDLNGDGRADLAVGVPDEDVESVVDAGAVNVLYGSQDGLMATGDPAWNQHVQDVVGTAEAGDRFGAALAIGHSGAGLHDDLAIGIPNEDVMVAGVNVQDAGAVHILVGATGGLHVAGNRIWHQNDADVEDQVEPGDAFGSSLAFGRWATALPRPDGLLADYGTHTAALTVAWNPAPADYYLVYSRPSGEPVTARQLLGETTLTWYLDQAAPPGAWMAYQVRACNVYGCGPFSDPAYGWRGIEPPQDLEASDGSVGGQVHVTWSATTGATWYKLVRATSPDGEKTWVRFEITDLSYQDTTAEPSIQYTYWVAGCAGDVDFERCSELSDYDTGYHGQAPPKLVFLPVVLRN